MKRSAGAEVTVISGITEDYELEGVNRINVTTAIEMNDAVRSEMILQMYW